MTKSNEWTVRGWVDSCEGSPARLDRLSELVRAGVDDFVGSAMSVQSLARQLQADFRKAAGPLPPKSRLPFSTFG